MQADQFDQSPEQVTLTHTWHQTRRVGVDDEEIERVRKAVAAERRNKPFRHKRKAKSLIVELPMEESEISELTQGVVLEATVDQTCSSADDAFADKLISPEQKRARNSRVSLDPETPVATRPKVNMKTPEHKKRSPDRNRIIRDLQVQLIEQTNTIEELREKLYLITEIANDTIKRKPKNGRREIPECSDVPQVSTINVGDGRSITVRKSDVDAKDIQKSTNTINLYIN